MTMNIHERTILIVEDLKADARLIERSLRKARIVNPCHLFGDGQQAIDYLSGTGQYADRGKFVLPLIILLDIKMPKRDGFDVLFWIRQQKLLKRIPVVMLTSSNRPADIERAYDLGANSYLVKPVSDDALIEMFRAFDAYWLCINEFPEGLHDIN